MSNLGCYQTMITSVSNILRQDIPTKLPRDCTLTIKKYWQASTQVSNSAFGNSLETKIKQSLNSPHLWKVDISCKNKTTMQWWKRFSSGEYKVHEDNTKLSKILYKRHVGGVPDCYMARGTTIDTIVEIKSRKRSLHPLKTKEIYQLAFYRLLAQPKRYKYYVLIVYTHATKRTHITVLSDSMLKKYCVKKLLK